MSSYTVCCSAKLSESLCVHLNFKNMGHLLRTAMYIFWTKKTGGRCKQGLNLLSIWACQTSDGATGLTAGSSASQDDAASYSQPWVFPPGLVFPTETKSEMSLLCLFC